MLRWRNLLILLGIFLFLLIEAPFFSGVFYKKFFMRMIATPALSRVVQVQHYSRGWFSSDIVYKVVLNNANSASALQIVDHVVHGPFLYDPINRKIKLGLAHVASNIKVSSNVFLLNSPLIFNTDTFMAVDNHVYGRFFASSMSGSSNKIDINFAGATGNFNFFFAYLNPSKISFNTDFHIGNLQLTQKNSSMKIVIGPSVFDANGESSFLADTDIFASNLSYSISNFNLIGANIHKQVHFNNLTLVNKVQVLSPNLFSFFLKASLDNLNFNGLKFDASKFNFSVQKLDKNAFQDMIKNARRNIFSDEKIITPNSQVDGLLQSNTQYGALKVMGSMHWSPEFFIATKKDILSGADSQLDVRIAKALFNELAVNFSIFNSKTVKDFTKKFLLQDKDDYISNISFNKDGLKINRQFPQRNL